MGLSLFVRFSAGLLILALMSCQGAGNPGNQLFSKNILGGKLADSNFQKQNGVVLIVLSMSAPVTPKNPNGRNHALCTGSLISPTLVLTAAHCLADSKLIGAGVVFSTDLNTATSADVISASTFKINSSFNPGSTNGAAFAEGSAWNDLAIIKLSKAAPNTFQLAQLPDGSQKITSTDKLTLAGYGVTTPLINKIVTDPATGKASLSPLPTAGAGTLRLVSDVEILTLTKDNKEIVLDQKNGATGACHGDSGGPAYLKKADGNLVLVGITSRGTDLTGNCDQSNVFTGVFGYLDWIKENLNTM